MAQGGIKDANLSCILPDHQLNQLPSARQGEKNQQDQAFSHAVGISIVEATQQNLNDDATMNPPGPPPMQPFLTIVCLICWLIAAPMANAEPIQITMRSISAEGVGDVIGSVTAKDSDQGLVIFPDLVNLTSGDHGFHLHSNPSCEAALNSEGESVAGLAAGGHWDPDNSGTHLGPFGSGHRGDLSKLIVDADESTKTSVVAPRLITNDLKGHALIVHAGGDTYSDTPALGGGGARVACGVVN